MATIEIKEIREQNQDIYGEVKHIKQILAELLEIVTPPAKEEGDWKDCCAWLQEISGGPKPTTRKSLSNLCGKDKLFKPGQAYQIKSNRRVFIRKGVEEAVENYLADARQDN